MRRIRILRILCFAIVYFSIHLTYTVFFMIRKFSEIPEASWYLQNPLKAFQKVVFELSHSPHLLFLAGITLSSMIMWALLLGFVTDLIFIILKKHISYRKRPVE